MKFTNIGTADISGLPGCIGTRIAALSDRDRRRTSVSLNERHLGARTARLGVPTDRPAVAGVPAGAEVKAVVVMGESVFRLPHAELRHLQGKPRVPSRSHERHRLVA